LRVTNGEDVLNLGTAEIRVFGNGRIYTAPDMIYHYITLHEYQPPDEFIAAVLASPDPSSEAYQSLLMQLALS
jgi:hypothetical protein